MCGVHIANHHPHGVYPDGKKSFRGFGPVCPRKITSNETTISACAECCAYPGVDNFFRSVPREMFVLEGSLFTPSSIKRITGSMCA
ncbi:hypothetical protein M7I_1741 [Glarea lozoyensis 74030]|uniref:Uncharacterized protein n=1 Tax=Glarea lozoyensis (strain ATCC 74030 / MF5533) TaxID=1104152 RepID=H0EH07_GLAL7|nr:hypothetical protein M7I_1741 [Glarea lozoyensis 74030]